MNPINRKRFFIALAAVIGLLLTLWVELFLQRNHHIIGAGINRPFLFLLINAHLLVIIFLLFIITRQSIKLFIERKQNIPGSVFKRNLVFAFTFFTVIPSCFIFFTAGKFIATSIDYWFRAHIEHGLNNSLRLHEIETQEIRTSVQKLGREFYACFHANNFEDQNNHEKLLNTFTHFLQEKSNELEENQCTAYLWHEYELRVNLKMRDEILIWRQFRKLNDRSMHSLRKEFVQKIEHACHEKLFDFYGSLYWVKKVGKYILVIAKRYEPSLRYPLIEVQNALSDYAQLKSMKDPIYWTYIFTFLLLSLLILFLAIWCAFYLARGITKPIHEILNATAQIRNGKWDIQVAHSVSDDFKTLVDSFNEMTQTLDQARKQLEAKNHELFNILENIKACVFLINPWGRIIMYNTAAKEFVAQYLKITRFKNQKINVLGSTIKNEFFKLTKELRTQGKKQLTQELSFSFNQEERTLIVHLTIIDINILPKRLNRGMLVVLEDVSDLVKANKLKTWQEAAKQMAHEVKNPLTPIQLATQRLQRRLGPILTNDTIFSECTNIILQQVAIIKTLITHFSEFASMPTMNLEFADFNQSIHEVVALYQISYPEFNFICDFAPNLPQMKTDIKKIKRVFINLLDNSVRALQQQQKTIKKQGIITITTTISDKPHSVEIIFTDNGPGIPHNVREKLFLPYVSSEKKNMGLGLAIIHDIITQLGGKISLEQKETGIFFRILLPQ